MPLNSGLAGLVNQAAFTNTMNMSMLAQTQRTQQMIPPQQLQQQRHPQKQQATSPTRFQRTFIGVVTKLMETYGFVDEDVFFQTNVIRGSMPGAGDRVMVEANYNPSMPFKWNASRIQLIQDATQNQSSVRQPQHQNVTSGGGSRWGEDENSLMCCISPSHGNLVLGGSGFKEQLIKTAKSKGNRTNKRHSWR